MRPLDLPAAEHFPHGTRSRYVTGCRCALCRAATRAVANERARSVREAAAEATPNGPPLAGTLTRAGKLHHVKICPGTGGNACVRGGAWLRTGAPVCLACVDRALVWNGPVSAAPARAHLLHLARKGVGRRAVADACDVSRSILLEIRTGKTKTIRAQTARRILSVTTAARADSSTVSARRTWQLIERLIQKEDFTVPEIAKRLGFKSRTLQFGRTRVLARTALRVERFYRSQIEEASLA